MRISSNPLVVGAGVANKAESLPQAAASSRNKIHQGAGAAHGSQAMSQAAGLPRLGAVSAPGMSADQLDSMLQTSLKM